MSRCIRLRTAPVARAHRLLIAGALIAGLVFPPTAHAETIRIVAIGTSNINGKHVRPTAAWPARLEAMLRARGYDAQVLANAVGTTNQMRARLRRAIAPGVHVVILSIPHINDRRRKIDTSGNIASMRAMLEARQIKLVVVDRPHVWADYQLQTDRMHFTAAGHKTVAAKLTARVIEELGADN